ncbi:hypothetical protein MKW92_032605 [Papaver armeniacum]|nr:hypothetical protein MKW92_032605 [Papaver armeniacum]
MAFGCFPCGKSSYREDDTDADQVESPYMVVNAPVFKINELHVATDNFNHRYFWGQGRLGCVYKGILEDGQVSCRHLLFANLFLTVYYLKLPF